MPLFYDGEVRVYKTTCGPFDNNAYLFGMPTDGRERYHRRPHGPRRGPGGGQRRPGKGHSSSPTTITTTLRVLWRWWRLPGAPVASHSEDAHTLPVAPASLVKDGDSMTVGDIEVKVIHTPGHTLGSVCYLAGKHLFTGDTLFPGGPGRSRSPEALQQIIENITGKLYTLPDDTALLPGHGKDSALGISKEEYRIFSQRDPPRGSCAVTSSGWRAEGVLHGRALTGNANGNRTGP